MSITVYCHRHDRLGARLKNFLYASIFSRRIDAGLIANWAPTAVGISLDHAKARSIDHDVYCFFDLFDEAIFRRAFPDTEITHLDDNDLKNLWKQVKSEESLSISQMPSLGYSYFQVKDRSPIFYDSTNPYRFLDDAAGEKSVGSHFKLLPLHSAIEKALTDVVSKLDLQQALCLHVRRGDLMNISDIADALTKDRSNTALRSRLLNTVKHFVNRFAPYHAYEAAISALGGDSDLIIMSDDENVKKRFIRDYGSRCLDYQSILDQHELTAQQRDFVEFLIIAESGTVVGTESAFVDFSARIGGKNVFNALSLIEISQFVEELKTIFRIDALGSALLIDILNLYVESFSRRPRLADKSDWLMKFIRDV